MVEGDGAWVDCCGGDMSIRPGRESLPARIEESGRSARPFASDVFLRDDRTRRMSCGFVREQDTLFT